MDLCLRVTYRYHDADVVELVVTAWNGTFGGSTKLYVGRGELDDVAGLLTGFPARAKDRRETTLGAFGEGFAGGAAKLQFSCRDGAGHSGLDVTIEADYKSRGLRTERVELSTAFEPAALDRFVGQVRLLNKSLGGSAVLHFA